MKVTINLIPEQCIACGLCHLYAKEIFDYHDNGIVKFYNSSNLTEEFPKSDELTKAVKSCPTRALHILKN